MSICSLVCGGYILSDYASGCCRVYLSIFYDYSPETSRIHTYRDDDRYLDYYDVDGTGVFPVYVLYATRIYREYCRYNCTELDTRTQGYPQWEVIR